MRPRPQGIGLAGTPQNTARSQSSRHKRRWGCPLPRGLLCLGRRWVQRTTRTTGWGAGVREEGAAARVAAGKVVAEEEVVAAGRWVDRWAGMARAWSSRAARRRAGSVGPRQRSMVVLHRRQADTPARHTMVLVRDPK